MLLVLNNWMQVTMFIKRTRTSSIEDAQQIRLFNAADQPCYKVET